MTEQLVFQKLAAHTWERCQRKCKIVAYRETRCCDEMYCREAIRYAAERGITLEPTGHPTIPLMGDTGCIAEPHLRPLCAMESCIISSWGFDPDDPEWTQEYFRLRKIADEALNLEGE